MRLFYKLFLIVFVVVSPSFFSDAVIAVDNASAIPQWQALLAKIFPVLAMLVMLTLWWLSQAIKSKQRKGLALTACVLALALCLAAVVLGKSIKPDTGQPSIIINNLPP